MDLGKIIQECKQGSAAAQKYLFDEYAERMLVVCYRYVKNREDAEELMLNGFFNFFKHIRRFNYEGESSLLPWLKKIMVNECLMFLRKKNVFHLAAENEVKEIPANEEILSGISAEDIYKLILELPTGYRTVFNLYVIEGMSHKEIAGALHISEGTSKSQLSKARSLLQQMLLQNNHCYAREQSR